MLCVAVPNEKIEAVKGVFMKELKDATDGWADPEGLLDTIFKKGNMAQIMQFAFPYVHVDFEGKGGMMKIIKNPDKFPEDFVGVCLCFRETQK